MTLQHRAEATKTQSQWGGPVSHAATAAQVAAPAAGTPSTLLTSLS